MTSSWLMFDFAGIPPEQQKMIYGGKLMDNCFLLTLADYNVTPSSALHLVLRCDSRPIEEF
jgi:hypothetical protein